MRTDFNEVHFGKDDLPSEIDLFNQDNINHQIRERLEYIKETIAAERQNFEKIRKPEPRVITESVAEGD